MDEALLRPFLDAVTNVIRTMAFTSVEAGKPEEKRSPIACGVVTAACGLVGRSHQGSFAITFEEPALLAIVSRMLYTEMTELGPDAVEAVGEIANMVSGGARRDLEQIGCDLDMSIPVLITGSGHQITHRGRGPVTQVRFQTEWGAFFLEVLLTPRG
ncbi:MAG: chemotaxis protein CheX [Candidatus Methylomirabilis sp.]|nr:chemotaxis protein CheX [Deltaproteobacteria bacterium]